VALLPADGGAPLERGAWTSSGAKVLEHPVCGQRTFVLRVTRRTAVRRFVLRLSVP
jgi:transcriptional regulator of NAD metabolism